MCVMYADTSCVKTLQDKYRNDASRLPDCRDICYCWQSYVLPCVCLHLYTESMGMFVCVTQREEDGWIFGRRSQQRTWEQPCSLNIHVWYPQCQFILFSLNIKGVNDHVTENIHTVYKRRQDCKVDNLISFSCERCIYSLYKNRI